MTPDPRTRFLIVGMARSGTTVTQQAVQGHPNIRCCMDELKVVPLFTKGISAFTVSGVNDFELDHGFGLLIDALSMLPCELRGDNVMGYGGTDRHPKQATLANGIKVAVSSADEAEQLLASLQRYSSLQDIAVVRVDRHDWVAQCASLARAKRSGRWHSFYATAPAVADPNAPFEIPEHEFAYYCRDALGIQRAFDRIGETHRLLDLSYEQEIAPSGRAAYRRVFEFLGVPVMDPDWLGSEKVAPPVASYVRNAARLYEMLDELRSVAQH